MENLPPDAAARALLDGFLEEPGMPALERVLAWLLDASPVAEGFEIPRNRRLTILADVLAGHPSASELKKRLQETWRRGLSIRFLAETGLPANVTPGRETIDRLVDRVVPRLEPENDFSTVLGHLRLSDADATWVSGLTAEHIKPWKAIVAVPRERCLEAVNIVAIRISAVGLSRPFLNIEPERDDADSPFFRLTRVVQGVIDDPADAKRWEAWEECREACRGELDRADELADTRGVSTDLIYRMEFLDAQLSRLDRLLQAGTSREPGRGLASDLVHSAARGRGVRVIWHTALKRLARKVTEHTGEHGEHYVASNRLEWRLIGRSACWGGVVAGITAAVKLGIASLPLPPMPLGIAYTINYAVAFVLMQVAGFTLASRQPSMTAAALASALARRDAVETQVELVAGITRSQIVATLGNVLLAIPIGLLIGEFGLWATGEPLISIEKASAAVHGINPIRTMVVPFAAVTGVFLWLSSLASGWADNGSAARRLPEAIASHRKLRATLGPERVERLAEFTDRNLGGIVGYLVLAFLMGFMPLVFVFMGLPIDAPHVSLNAGAFAMGVGALDAMGVLSPAADIAWGLAGIVMIGAMNILVSFALALRTAMRARDLSPEDRLRLRKAILGGFRRSPARFLWRPRR
jgi:site-specific recombinase